MARELIISISGMRGVIGENLTPAIATEYGAAFGTFLRAQGKTGPVCIGRDSRPSGQMLSCAVAGGLCSVGLDVVTLGIVTTPTVGVMVRQMGCSGGVIITASHNPIEYNGIKLLLANGIAPSGPLAEQIRDIYTEKRFTPADSVGCGHVSHSDDPDTVHIEKVLAIVDKDRIAQRQLTVVLDSVNGAGGRPGKRLLRQLGCNVIAMNDEPTGLFAHTPEPIAENLGDLCARVIAEKASAGFAQDPDADRLAIVDENGRFIGEEYTLALAAKQVFSERSGSAATNLSTSRMIDDIAEVAGATVIRTPVGEANVAQAIIENDCVIGGEGNGGVIDMRVGPVRDSLVAMALVLQLVAETGKSVSQLVGEIGGYSMVKTKFAADKNQAQAIIARAVEVFARAGARVNSSDGCRFDFEDGWVHLRTSNTEPVMRSIVEARTEEAVAGYVRVVEEICRQIL